MWLRTVFSLMRSRLRELDQNFSLARREVREDWILAARGRGLPRECEHFFLEALLGGLVLEQNVIARVEQRELRARDLRREYSRLAERHGLVVARVQDERWHADPTQ